MARQPGRSDLPPGRRASPRAPHPPPTHPLAPRWHRVAVCSTDTADVTTLVLTPCDGGTPVAFRAGQFAMLSVPGVGEAAISVSATPGEGAALVHTVRDVGAVTHALCAAEVGDVVGVRGAYGTDWGVERLWRAPDLDVVVVAGGIGLAPLRGAVEQLQARPGPGRLAVLIGARSPDQLLFGDDVARWRAGGAHVAVTVDTAPAGWSGAVGVVTELLDTAPFEPARTVALVCGPEVMIRFVSRAFVDHGVDPGSVLVALERNMQCGVGWCGHCQLGPLLLCRDGPVVPYAATVRTLLDQRER